LNVKTGAHVDANSPEGKKIIASGEQVFPASAGKSHGGKSYVVDSRGVHVDPNSPYGKRLLAGGRPLISGATVAPKKTPSGPAWSVAGSETNFAASSNKTQFAGSGGFWAVIVVCAIALVAATFLITYTITRRLNTYVN